MYTISSRMKGLGVAPSPPHGSNWYYRSRRGKGCPNNCLDDLSWMSMAALPPGDRNPYYMSVLLTVGHKEEFRVTK